MKKDTKYTLLLTLLYFTVSLIGIRHHELWLDESHHWLMARDCTSFPDLILRTSHDGHPVLWNILLYAITRFTSNPFWMQLMHIAISASVVFLFLRKAPFAWAFKILFIFGYFMIFEYNLISRNYILGVFFLFLACSVFEQRDKKFMTLSLCLALAANVHLMFGIVAAALFVVLLFENYPARQCPRKSLLAGSSVFMLGLGIAVFPVVLSDKHWFFHGIHELAFTEKCIKGYITLFKGLFAIPDFSSLHFWNSNSIVNFSKPIAAVLGLLSYAIPLLIFRKSKTLFFVYAALSGLQIFFFVTQLGATRYDGMAFLTIIAGLWLEQYFGGKPNRITPRLPLLKIPIVYGILTIHFMSGIFAFAMDYNYPFTASKQAASFLKTHHLNDRPIVCVGCEGTALSPYLGKKIWFLCNGSYQSYCLWDQGCKADVGEGNIVALLTAYVETSGSAIFVSNSFTIRDAKPGIWIKMNGKVKMRFLKKFDQTIVRKSGYYIYEISKL